ncbi:glycosyltransferase [Sulfitobacter sp. F26204]|uniref:glycosyltransferase family protein n=1 Tax=Sulfitobacter sp. F26204 TaxID=2996014 RepID=UPI00225DE4AE|nr:glycosyltransferase [Sulfitobacter sp. F26204]MCX7560428.1 glycosyltransferase [Sulfitobacter sp. F26204]
MKVMIVVTHLLGTGHLARAATLAHAFKDAGHRPVIVSGGLPVQRFENSDLELVQLPPVRSDGVDFSRLLTPTGTVADAAHLQARQRQIIDVLQILQPDILITELFPFGRRILKDEFTALLLAARALPQPLKIFASVRDILAPPSKPSKVSYADQIIAQHYDAVLVHSDPDVTPLDLSWPVSDSLRPKLQYTGFVAPPPVQPDPAVVGADEIIVSAGGGAVGRKLFDCARLAATNDPDTTWRLLIGGADAAVTITALQQGAPGNLIVEGLRPEFRQMLHHVRASVSFCGYNTAQDILQTDCPAVFVPFDDGGEVEQSIRATALGRLDGIEVLASSDMTPAKLLQSLNAAVSAPRRPHSAYVDGGVKTVQISAGFGNVTKNV